VRLVNVLHTDKKLTLVFEYLDQDLKHLLDTCGPTGLPEQNIKVIKCFKTFIVLSVSTLERNREVSQA